MSLLIRFFVSAIAVYLTAAVLPGIHVTNFVSAMIVALVLGVINTILKPILTIITFPINLLTLGLFSFVVNGLLILLVSHLVSGFIVDGFLWAIAFSFVLSIVGGILHSIVK